MRTIVLFAAVSLTSGCGGALEPVEHGGNVVIAEAGDTVDLRFGESALLGTDGARITFTTVESDSRCPVDVTCVWAGDAHVRITGDGLSSPAQSLDLHTGVEPVAAEFAGYRIRLIDVTPVRRENDTVRPSDYSIRLAISRG
ncbi:MAG: hypothetical protein KFH98_09450 [Gemmatimonadetes bacterium]|nr:hypothetical protein [Gemmatimonadota bacterium]